ncbi:YmaF family protein [Terrilactibacillus laevilacticus]|uniref:YmaF family protein n=1 Tax=Terrilactibacillus laevilacticus TaxID=1380157 RepID=UPI001146AD1A|nr:YmaF family protein [Terrilactibacillus laevilacticus]
MEIPISGFMYHSDDSGTHHSHQLFITSWDGRPVHVHQISGITSFDAGHNHRISGVTGPAIPIPNGGHYHEFRGVTSVNGVHPHTHRYSGRTSP